MTKIALDAMGGDFAPGVNIQGALLAAQEIESEIVLVGHKSRLEKELHDLKAVPEKISICHAEEVIESADPASLSIRKKKDSSLNVAFQLLKDGVVDAVVSPGHSGAFMASALMILKRLPGVERPAITIMLPTLKGPCVMLDMGANVDCKPSHLAQFAVMGAAYARVVLGYVKPAVALLSNGEEEGKGNEVCRQAHDLLKSGNLNYVGYIEGRDMFQGDVHVIVCDGFVGNILLKSLEGAVGSIVSMFKTEMNKNILAKVSFGLFALSFRDSLRKMKRRFDYVEYGAAPLLGINGMAHLCHGRSSAAAIKNALKTAENAAKQQFIPYLHEELKRMQP